MLINAIISKKIPVELYGMDIETLSSSFTSIMFVFIPKSLNSTVDAMENQHCNTQTFFGILLV